MGSDEAAPTVGVAGPAAAGETAVRKGGGDQGQLAETIGVDQLGDASDPRVEVVDHAQQRRRGRYLLLERLGSGAMGLVYAAYDPDLDRKVALKLVRPTARNRLSGVARQRLLREAQAMARVNHPNVITVHDVGEVDREVFIAMELVVGHTLGDWLEQGRTAETILEVFVQAGRGPGGSARHGPCPP